MPTIEPKSPSEIMLEFRDGYTPFDMREALSSVILWAADEARPSKATYQYNDGTYEKGYVVGSNDVRDEYHKALKNLAENI